MPPRLSHLLRLLPLLGWSYAATSAAQPLAALVLLALVPDVPARLLAYAGGALVIVFAARRLAGARRGWMRARHLHREIDRFRASAPPVRRGRSGGGRAEGRLEQAMRAIRAAPTPRLDDAAEVQYRRHLVHRALRPLRPSPLNPDPLLLVLAGIAWGVGGLSSGPQGVPTAAAAAMVVAVVLEAALRWGLRAGLWRLSGALAAWSLEDTPGESVPPSAYVHTPLYSPPDDADDPLPETTSFS